MSRPAKPQHRPWRSRLLVWPVGGAALALASCQSAGVLDPRGPVEAAERLLLINSTAIMLVVVVPVILATLAFAWWYRASNPRASHSTEHAYEGRIEFTVWSIPALTVLLLSGVIWISARISSIRARRSHPRPVRCRWTSSRSIGSGCSSIRTGALPQSISWSFRPGRR